jgi:predicted P-loop ATPase
MTRKMKYERTNTMIEQVKSYLEGLTWDGKTRILTVVTDYFNKVVDPDRANFYMHSVLAAAIERIYNPGYHIQNIPIIKGPQGCGKSKFIMDLAGPWYIDFDLYRDGILNKEGGIAKMKDGWILEILIEPRTSSMIYYTSRDTDVYREPYKKRPEVHNRHCLFIGTTNTKIDNIPTEWLFEVDRGEGVLDRDQIWAEMMNTRE